MAICSSGISEPKPTSPPNITITADFASGLVDFPAWLIPWLAYVPVATFDVGEFCSVDPPTLLTLPDASDFSGVFVGALGAAGLVGAYISTVIEQFMWYQLCQCATVATPSPPAAPTPPANLPTVNPGQAGNNVCATAHGVQVHDPGAGCTNCFYIPQGEDASGNGFPVPANARSILVTVVDNPAGADHSAIDWSWNLLDNDFTSLAGNSGTATSGSTFTFSSDIPTGATRFWFYSDNSSSTTDGLDVTVQFICPNQGGISGGCCPPDPVSLATLQQLLQLVTLLQRQTAPFAYVTGATHTGLTGTGSFGIDSSLGLLLNVSVPARAGRVDGTPVTVFECGWINFATPDGYTERFFVSSDGQVILPRLPGLYTAVGYSFAPDVTVTITEIDREP
jgi:hypothetical protein